MIERMSAGQRIELSSHQLARLAQFGVEQCVDMHCHVLHGIDDGPVDLDETLTLCRALVRDGITPRIVLAHSERYDSLVRDPPLAEEWIRRGAALQINAGAVTGAYGPAAARASFDWLSRGWVSLVATDAHSLGKRRPRFSEAIDAVVTRFGTDVTRCVCIENPLRVLRGQPLLPAPVPSTPVPSKSGPDASAPPPVSGQA